MPKTNILARSRLKKAQQYLQQGQMADARVLLEQVCSATPSNAEAWLMLGVLNGREGHPDVAVENFRAAYRLKPSDPQIIFNYGIALRESGDTEKAIQAFRKTLELVPDHDQAGACLADTLSQVGEDAEAEAVFRQTLKFQPRNAELHANLGSLLQGMGRVEEAVTCYEEAMRINPGLPAYDSYGSALSGQGRFTEALEVYREGLRRQPGNARLYSNLLMDLNYISDIDPRSVFDEHCGWGRVHGNPPGSIKKYSNKPDPEKRLRIGYVSPDFRNHSVAYYIEPLLASHDHEAFEVYCYSVMPKPDETTLRLKGLADHWRDIFGWTDKQLVRQVRDDRIDILVDLAGHTAHNCLTVFAMKPAPVQATYLGYPNTTGLIEIDYRLTDERADPPGQEAFYTEKLERLPGCFLCYRPPLDAPAVTVLPALSGNGVTFGSFNNLAKVVPDVVEAWSAVIKAVPGSRLLVKNPALTDAVVRERFHARFMEHGIEDRQIELLGHTPTREEHLAMYGQVDIALDTFPYNGTTTTCEALWMGVPVIVLEGRTHAGRVGVSLLGAVGLSDWVAPDHDGFVAIARQRAENIESLARLRTQLRDRVMTSSLCDEKGFAGKVEVVYRRMWRSWCDLQDG